MHESKILLVENILVETILYIHRLYFMPRKTNGRKDERMEIKR